MEAIIVAEAQLLTEEGFEALTTARAAERAGVSAGSLYPYFPNKRALVAAVVDHHVKSWPQPSKRHGNHTRRSRMPWAR